MRRSLLVLFFQSIFLVNLLFSGSSLLAKEEPELLKSQDVAKIMQQIFDEHVDQKEMSTAILKHSFHVFFEQFDPDRIYLLQSEIQPFTNPSNAEMAQYMEDYKKGDYTPYIKMNDLIQKAIARSREWRQKWEYSEAELFDEAKNLNISKDEDLVDERRPFANSLDELKKRLHVSLLEFILIQEHHYGVSAVLHKEGQVLSHFEVELRAHENQYLYKDELNKNLSTAQKDHLLTLHILKALAKSLDAHTAFFNSAEAYDMKVRLEKGYEGIGVIFQEGIDGVYVSSLVPGGPADKNGQIRPHDQIVSIDGKRVAGESFNTIMDMVRGEVGTPITLGLVRKKGTGGESQDELVNVTLKREKIVMNQDRVEYSSEPFGDGIIGKITLHSFYQNSDGISSEKDVEDAINKLKQEGKLRGLVLDLRENSGGYLSQAIKVAGLFITNGVVVISKYSNGEERFYRDLDSHVAYNGPLIILTSRLTASAAEIVAEALQDYGVALVVGDERTYGKGSIQSQTVTNNQSTSYFKVTVGKYYTVSGKSPQQTGVKADIVVPGPYNHTDIGEEYLEYPLKADTIPPAFQDNLSDVNPDMKAWYLKYYMPSLQHKTESWKNMVPYLKKNSAYRLAHNKDFQYFLKKTDGKADDDASADNDAEDTGLEEPVKKNFGSDDLQMDEAVNIAKDMVLLKSSRQTEIVGKRD